MKMIRAVTLLLAIGLGFVACDENPVDEGAGEVYRMELSASFLSLTVAGEKSVAGYTVDRYGAPTFDNVTATSCNASVAIRPDTTMLPIEPPTRIVARGASAGSGCIIFTGGGFTDTVTVRVQ